LAREGSQFWVERPRVDTSSVRGLETITSGRHLAVNPAPSGRPLVSQFEGLELPPPHEILEGSLEIVLVGTARGGLQRGIPVTFRGLPIGHIQSVGLARDSGAVEARAVIEPGFKSLVRENTVFWDDSGIDVSVGLTGFKLDTDNLASVVVGTVAMATPDPPGKPAATGHRFAVFVTTKEKEKRDEWATWQPQITVGHDLLESGLPLPQPLRASLRWTKRRFGIKDRQQRSGWVLPLDDGRLLGPSDLFGQVKDAIDNRLTLEVAGQEIEINPTKVIVHGHLSTMKLDGQLPDAVERWPAERIRRPTDLEDALLVTAPRESDVPLSANRFTASTDAWQIASLMPVVRDHHGACLVSLVDGSLIGMVIFPDDEKPLVAFAKE
jgi:hypothetical protein